MSFETGMILSIILLGMGGVGMAIFAIAHRERSVSSHPQEQNKQA